MSSGRKRARDHLKPLTEDSCLGVPDDLWNDLNLEFSFTVDASSTHRNAKCARHWTLEEDGLSQSWTGETVWCHPLFDRNIYDWVQKGCCAKNCLSVFLLPASTDTKWFSLVWDHVRHKPRPGCEVRFLPRRLKYKPAGNCAAFASCVVVIKNR